ncbi:MAG: PIN domain-containing protein [Solirubrobacteraceae bacterium]
MTLLDSAVVAGFLKADDALHAAASPAVRAAAAEGSLIASVVTVTELLAGARLGHHDEQVVWDFFRQLVATIIPFTLDLADRAAELRAGHRALKLPDAIILATGEQHADTIVTADERWGGVTALRCPVTVVGS